MNTRELLNKYADDIEEDPHISLDELDDMEYQEEMKEKEENLNGDVFIAMSGENGEGGHIRGVYRTFEQAQKCITRDIIILNDISEAPPVNDYKDYTIKRSECFFRDIWFDGNKWRESCDSSWIEIYTFNEDDEGR